MTKLEAWQAWCTTAGTADLATEFTLEQSSHGKAFSFAWDAAVQAEREECANVALTGTGEAVQLKTLEIIRAERERIADAIRSRTCP